MQWGWCNLAWVGSNRLFSDCSNLLLLGTMDQLSRYTGLAFRVENTLSGASCVVREALLSFWRMVRKVLRLHRDYLRVNRGYPR